MSDIKAPASRPCGSCPYRIDVPSGVWHESEYEKLPTFDGETFTQPPSVFMCHQQDERLCAGWVGCHDMEESFGLRIAVLHDRISPEDLDATFDYVTDVPLFASGAEAAAHGLREVYEPGADAARVGEKLRRKGLA